MDVSSEETQFLIYNLDTQLRCKLIQPLQLPLTFTYTNNNSSFTLEIILKCHLQGVRKPKQGDLEKRT